MSTTIGGLKYMGNIGGSPGYFETPDAEWDEDDYGLDVLTRNFDVRPDATSISAFTNKYKKGFQDTQFPWMYVTGKTIKDVSGVLGKATVTFKGATIDQGVNPILPRKESIKFGLVTQVVSLSDLLNIPEVDNANNSATRDVTYRAPWSEWRYITTNDPKLLGPRHDGEIIQNDKTAKVLWARGAFGATLIKTEIIPPGQYPGPPSGGQFVGLLKVVKSKFDVDQVGSVYTVLERNELIVVDYLMFLYNNLTGW